MVAKQHVMLILVLKLKSNLQLTRQIQPTQSKLLRAFWPADLQC